ncbi:MAG: sensor histidine kinase [Bacteroidales bacterium]|nr:sensor histidine kinase [Bacteroidales bacterium]
MLTQVALLLAVSLQLVSAVIVISLIRATKYNSSWILLSIAFLLMAFRRIADFIIPNLEIELREKFIAINSWTSFLISLLLVVGVFYVRKVLHHLFRLEELRRSSEKQLLNAVIKTEENERKRFSKELHDGLGPLLSAVKMSISTLIYNEKEGQKKSIQSNALALVNESISSLRELSNNMSPHVLENFGLKAAIEAFCSKLNNKTLSIKFKTNIGNKKYNTHIEIVIYRSICELVNNTFKHARAKNVSIQLIEKENLLNLQFRDDGCGFNVNEINKSSSSGMGLYNINSRVKSLSGNFTIESSPNGGTAISLQIPFQ